MNKFKPILIISLMFLILMFISCGCGKKELKSESVDGLVKITLINSKVEIQTQLENAAKAFSNDYKNIKIDVLTASTGQSTVEKVEVMYASGEAPTMSMLDGIDVGKFADKSLDLSKEDWVKDTSFSEGSIVDDKLVAFPFAVEGCGLIYNKKVLDKASVKPEDINTRTELKEAFKKIKESGSAGCVIEPMDWSLANHLCTVFIANKSKNIDEVKSYILQLKEGNINLENDDDFNGFMETFKLLMDYNISKDEPMSVDYTKCVEYICSDDVAFYYQGNWTWPEFETFEASEDNYGFIPLPISDKEGDIANSSLQIGVTKFIILDSTQKDKEKQETAKKFLSWLVYNIEAQKIMVNDAKIIMAFENVKIQPQDSLRIGILDYISNEKTMVFVGNLMPSDYWKVIGPSYQKFLVGKSTKSDVVNEIENYWKSDE